MHDDIFKSFWFEVIAEAGEVECGCPGPHDRTRLLSERIPAPSCVDLMLGEFMHHAVALFESRRTPRTPPVWNERLVTAGVRLLGTAVNLPHVALRPVWNKTLVEVVRPAVSGAPGNEQVFADLESEASGPPSNSRWGWHENKLTYHERCDGPLGRLNFAIHQEDDVVFLHERVGYTFTTAVEAIDLSREAHRRRAAMLRSLAVATDTFAHEMSKLRA
jgi:hypothetical protein